MYQYCQEEGRHIETDVDYCENECETTDCENHPAHEKTNDEKILEKFRSSEFASEVMSKMAVMFNQPEEDVARKLDNMFTMLQSTCEDTTRKFAEEAVQVVTTKYFDSKMRDVLDETFKKAIEGEIMAIDKDDDAVLTSIRKNAQDKVRDYLFRQKKDSRYGSSESIEKVINDLVDERVKDAIDEIKTEAIEKFGKMAMKKMMAGMGQAIQNDKRLLAMMTAE